MPPVNHIAGLVIVCLGCSTASGTETADTEDAWKLRRDRDGIQVHTRKVEDSSYAAVKSTTVLQGVKLASLVALLEDVEACPDWADKCAESYVYERVSDTESYIYTHNAMPFPIKDRDVLAHVIWNQDRTALK